MFRKILGIGVMSEHEKRFWWAGFYWGITWAILALIIGRYIGI
jgi:hypothetical protein